MAVDEAVRRQEPLRLLRRLEPLHLPLAPPRRSVRVLRAAVQMAARSVPNPGQEVAPCDAVAPRAVGDEAPRLEPQPSQQPLGEALCRRAISPVLHQEVQHRPVLIDRAPKVVRDAVDAGGDFLDGPDVTRLRPAPTQLGRGGFAKLRHQRQMLSCVTAMPRSTKISSKSRRLKLKTW